MDARQKIEAVTDAELTRIYNEANGFASGKAQPITTAAIFKAMRACLATHTAEIAAREAEIARLREALGFYADPERYHGPNQRVVRDHDPFTPEDAVYIQDVTRDNGVIARAALTTQPPKEPT